MKFVLLSLICFLSSCSVYVDGIEYHTISYDHKQPWLDQPMYDAIQFWQEHEGYFLATADKESGLYIDVVETLSPDRVAQCRCTINGTGTIDILQSRSDNDVLDNTCILAHEMGHSLGLEHVEDKNSLMHFSVYPDRENNTCKWSAEDQKEFDKNKYE